MWRQLVHGSLAVGEIVGHAVCGAPGWTWLTVLTGGVIASVSAVGLARRISEALVCVAEVDERH